MRQHDGHLEAAHLLHYTDVAIESGRGSAAAVFSVAGQLEMPEQLPLELSIRRIVCSAA